MPTAGAQVQLRNPDPKKKGPRMAKVTYAVVRAAALATRLARAKGWDPSLSARWYGMAIKLDLEARGELKRSGAPQRLTRA